MTDTKQNSVRKCFTISRESLDRLELRYSVELKKNPRLSFSEFLVSILAPGDMTVRRKRPVT